MDLYHSDFLSNVAGERQRAFIANGVIKKKKKENSHLVLWKLKTYIGLKYFRNIDCVVISHHEVQNRKANLNNPCDFLFKTSTLHKINTNFIVF